MLYERLKMLEKVVDRGPIFLLEDGGKYSLSFAQLISRARQVQGSLQANGFHKGDRLAIILADNEQCIVAFLGAVLAGIIPILLTPPPIIGEARSYSDLIRKILIISKTKALLVSERDISYNNHLLSKYKGLSHSVLILQIEQLLNNYFDQPSEVRLTPNDTCFLQFTSGSTADPKGAVVSHMNLVANAQAMLADTLSVNPATDVGVCWLPLYHDMGLVGNVLAALLYVIPVIYIPTKNFIKHPNIWMKAVSDYRATITFAPNFAFSLAGKRASDKFVRTLDLRCLRILGCGAEPINADVLMAFYRVFAKAGLHANAIMPCYGMAEATLAISFSRIDKPARVFCVDGEALERFRIAQPASLNGRKMKIVSCGSTFPGHEIRVISKTGSLCADGCVGEIVFRGPSVAVGYFENDEETINIFKDGWLHTGDMGFLQDGEIFITGRLKDLIIVNGRNYYPHDIEWIIENLDGVRTGDVAAFGVYDGRTERVVVVIEMRMSSELDYIEARIKESVQRSLGVSITEVVFIRAGTLPQTTSGKIQRKKIKHDYENHVLQVISKTN